MSNEITMAAEGRESRGKNEARRLRVRGLTPAVLYGAEKEAVPVAVNPREIKKILLSKSGHNTVFNLAITGGESTPVMVVDWQLDPIRDSLLHVDLKRIDPNKRLHVKVPVHTAGEPKGVKLQGGIFEIVTREIEIECLPGEIPEDFHINVSELNINEGVRASDIPLTGSMKLFSPLDQVIAHVVAPKGEAAADVAVAPTAEPEVIKKGKKDEAAAPAASGGGDKKEPKKEQKKEQKKK